MAKETMPAAEVEAVVTDASERQSYEFAFHILPTVAEGEVPTVFSAIKEIITKDGGEIFDEEIPERFDLAYEIVKHLEGKNRKFSSAYFGWVRFKCESGKIEGLTADIDSRSDILRYLLVKLSHVEETFPFRFHEALVDEKVTTVEDSEVATEKSELAEDEESGDNDDVSEEEGEKEKVSKKDEA